MRDARTADGWRRASQISNFNPYVMSLEVHGLPWFDLGFKLELDSGITTICGKNGTGKTSFLKLIYSALKSKSAFLPNSQNVHVEAKLVSQGVVTEYSLHNEKVFENTYLCNPAAECQKIWNFLEGTDNSEELIEGVEANTYFAREGVVNLASSIIGKRYASIKVYEVDDVIEPDSTFPYIDVYLANGAKYTIGEMGQGEFFALYLIWYLNWIPNNSILLLDELDCFTSVYTQTKLLDHIAQVVSQQSICLLLTTHSPQIIGRAGLYNNRIFYSRPEGQVSVVRPDHEIKYLNALGVLPSKKGAVLLEDKFARLFCEQVLKRFLPNFFSDMEFLELGGESNLVKLCKHFKPTKRPTYELIVIFDADQPSSVSDFKNEFVYSSCLPATSSTPPEKVVWEILESDLERVADKISVNPELLRDAIANFEATDYHDRYNSISSAVSVSFDSLVVAVIDLWLVRYTVIIKSFIVALESRGRYMTKQDIRELLDSKGLLDMFPSLEDLENEKSYRLLFDGQKLYGADSFD